MKFKYLEDLRKWRNELGPSNTRSQIALAGAIYLRLFGVGMVVTLWFRGDATAHESGRAFDIGVRYLSDDEIDLFLGELHSAGIPAYFLKPKSTSRHIHVGDIATILYELEGSA